MKLVTGVVLFVVFGAVSFADGQPGAESSLYDRIIKETYQHNQLLLDLNGKQYPFGMFADERPLLQAVSANPKAAKLFQESDNSRRTYTVLSLTSLGLDVAALIPLTVANPPNTASSVISLGLLGGALVLSFIDFGYLSDMQDKFYKGINQYNFDVLNGN